MVPAEILRALYYGAQKSKSTKNYKKTIKGVVQFMLLYTDRRLLRAGNKLFLIFL